MSLPDRNGLATDFHVHSTFSDDAVSTLAENIAAGAERGLTELRLVEHVRGSTTWVPDFVSAVAGEPRPDGILLRTGIEAKLLDASGALDLPAGLTGVDAVLIADHQFPGPDGPWSPREARQRLAAGLSRQDALDLLIGAMIGAMSAVESGQLAHCFSILPKVGLAEDDLTDDHLDRWAQTAAATNTLVEVNEKWGCPGPRVLAAAAAAGVTVVPATDSHLAAEVGRYRRVPLLLAEAGLR
ncbi:MAG TPA: histidinol-phosphatase [Lacisediminihabitans sp.]|uniref:histidinol-phosphatase n=1 Tax=Lacisediminihabitans sp. TaxID=2787631 RepID=UPI002EDB0CEE